MGRITNTTIWQVVIVDTGSSITAFPCKRVNGIINENKNRGSWWGANNDNINPERMIALSVKSSSWLQVPFDHGIVASLAF